VEEWKKPGSILKYKKRVEKMETIKDISALQRGCQQNHTDRSRKGAGFPAAGVRDQVPSCLFINPEWRNFRWTVLHSLLETLVSWSLAPSDIFPFVRNCNL